MRARIIANKSGRRTVALYPESPEEYARGCEDCRTVVATDSDSEKKVVITTDSQRQAWGLSNEICTGRVTPEEAKDVLDGILEEPDERSEDRASAPATERPSKPPKPPPMLAEMQRLFSKPGPQRGMKAPARPARDDGLRRELKTLQEELDIEKLTGQGNQGEVPAQEKVIEQAKRKVQQLVSGTKELTNWWRHVAEMPLTERAVESFDRHAFLNALDQDVGGWDQVKQRLADAVEACMRHRGWLCIEQPGDADAKATWVRRTPGWGARTGILICGPEGTGKITLMYAAARALGRKYESYVMEQGHQEEEWKGSAGERRGRIAETLAETGICNPILLVQRLDKTTEPTNGILETAMHPVEGREFVDDYLEVSWDVSGILWVATAEDETRVPEGMRSRMHLVQADPYTHADKIAIVRHRIANSQARIKNQTSQLCLDGDNARMSAIHELEWESTRIVWEGRLQDEETTREIAERTAYRGCGETSITSEGAEELVARYAEAEEIGKLCQVTDNLRELCVREKTTLQSIIGQKLRITTADVRRHLGKRLDEGLPRPVREAIEAERNIERDNDKEGSVDKRWIDWLENVPWTGPPAPVVAGSTIIERLDRTHAGRENAKRRLAGHIAAVPNESNASVMCLAGPPGVGKTSLAQAAADAARKPLVRLACGGWRDETDLRGHNRTWRGAQPGWIIRELRRAKCRWPVFLLDEIDKIGSDPAGVLLEIFDPSLRHTFRDAFLELPFDLSEVVFITTANDTTKILPALRDRLEIVQLAAYSDDEKVDIALDQLLPRAAKEAGLTTQGSAATRDACKRIVREYTREEGVRELERQLKRLCQEAAANGTKIPVGTESLQRLLGEPRPPDEDAAGTLAKRIVERKLPAHAHKAARRAMRVIESDATGESERNRARGYVETVLAMPWGGRTGSGPEEKRAPEKIRQGLSLVIEEQGEAKTTLSEWATTWTNGQGAMTIPCLSGAAGTGKSTLAEACGAAMGRITVTLDCRSLVNAEKVNGHEHGSCGEITRAMGQAQGQPVLVVLDQIDEVTRRDAVGATAAMLTARVEGTFVDHYLDIETGIDNCPILATARRFDQVGNPIAEQLEKVAVRGYTNGQKARIAKKLWARLTGDGNRSLDADVLKALITREPEKSGTWSILSTLRRLAKTATDIESEAAHDKGAQRGTTSRSGRAVGLYVDREGAGLLVIDAGRSRGTGKLTLSGEQNQSMSESVRSARQWLIERSDAFGLEPGWERSTDMHVHAGNVGQPKEGGSATLATAAALASAMTGRKVGNRIALTGELSLGDEVKPVGDVIEKLIGASRAGVEQVHVPEGNRREIERAGTPKGIEVTYAANATETVLQVLETESGADEDPAGRRQIKTG